MSLWATLGRGLIGTARQFGGAAISGALGGLAAATAGGGGGPPVPVAQPGGLPISTGQLRRLNGGLPAVRGRITMGQLAPGGVLRPIDPRTGFPFGEGRRRRRMSVTNVRALRRALRRVEGFEKVCRRVLTITTGRQPKVRFKRRRKRA